MDVYAPVDIMSAMDNASMPGSPRILTHKEFWYVDGNVVLHCHGIHFKLYRARISHYCKYFQESFQRSEDGANDQLNSMDGFRVHDVPAKVSLGDFEKFLDILERPMTHSIKLLAQDVATSLLRTAHALGCELIFELATIRLCALWPGNFITPPGYTADVARYRDALAMVAAAREYALPVVLKNALYEVLATSAHWTGLALSGLCEADVLCLCSARLALGDAWRAFILTPPRSDDSGASTCPGHGAAGGGMGSEFWSCGCCIHERGARARAWRAAIFEADEVLDKGAVDPLRYDGVPTIREEAVRQRFCRACLDEWQKSLAAKRKEWWSMLDHLLPS